MSSPPSPPPSPASSPHPRTLGRRLWPSFRLILILLLLTELGLRFILGLGNPIIYMADPSPPGGDAEKGCLYLPVPNQDTRRFFRRITLNRLSMRSPDFADAKPAGTTRLLFLGDSVTFGTSVIDQQDIFTTRLARAGPAKVGRPLEVLNLSCGGWAVPNEVNILRNRGTYQADLVVHVLNTGDLSQSLSSSLHEAGYPAQRPWSGLGEAWSRYAYPWLFGAPPTVDPGALPATLRPLEPLELRSALEGAREFTQAMRARYVLVYVPARGGAWEEHKSGFEARLQGLQDWCREKGVVLLDLSGDLDGHPAGDVYQDGIHLRVRGHELVARRLLAELPGLLSEAGGR